MNKYIWWIIIVIIIAALFIVFKGQIGGHVKVLDQTAKVEIGQA